MKLWFTTLVLLLSFNSLSRANPPTTDDLKPEQVWRLLQDGFGENWVGVWDQRISVLDCDTGGELFSQTSRDTLCPADNVEPGDLGGGGNFACSGTYGETQVNFDCSTTIDVFPGCQAFYAWNYTATLDGDSYTADITVNVTYQGDCPNLEPTCSKNRIVGTRVGPAPAGACDTAAEDKHWGEIKSRYE